MFNVKTVPFEQRKNKVSIEDFAVPSKKGGSFSQFLESLPNIGTSKDFKEVVDAIVKARKADRPVIMGIGAHVVKCGLSPIIIDLMAHGIITSIAMNGSVAIHDLEIALFGKKGRIKSHRSTHLFTVP